MSFTDLFIKRPVFACVLSLIILLVGIISYTRLPLRQFPKIASTEISVNTSFAGASPQVIETLVTDPIESALAGIDGLDFIKSNSTQGSSSIRLHFNLGTNMDAAISDVVNKVSSARSDLPSGVDAPVIEKNDPNAEPILFIAYSNPNVKPVQLNDYLVRVVQPELQTIDGVGQADIFGQLSYAMRLWLNPNLMTAHSITAQDVINALNANNLQAPTGRIENSTQEFNTAIDSSLSTAAQFDNLVIRNTPNSLVRLKDIGYAKLGTPERRAMGFLNGHPTTVMGIVPRLNANPLDVTKAVKAELKELSKHFPKGMTARVVWNNGKFIAESIKEVKQTIIEACIFVVLVIFLFLGSFRTITIPAVTIPLSLIGVCGLMYGMGFSLNTLTMLAFVLAIGMVVDDAIVVSENIHRQIEAGKSKLQAAIDGAREIRFAVIAMTLTLAAVYAPIVFMSGLTGALFREFAFTLAGAVIISGFVALTLSPMMCSKVLSDKAHTGKLESKIQVVTDKLAVIYKKALEFVLRYRSVVLVAIIAVFASCYFLYSSTPSELAPKEDMGGLLTIVQAPTSANVKYTTKYTLDVDKIYRSVPSGVNRLAIIGWPNGVNSALTFLTLKDWSKRKESVDDIIKGLFPKLMMIPGVEAFPINPFKLPGSSGLQSINFLIQTTGSYKQLYDVAQKVKAAAEKNPALANINIDLQFNKPQWDIHINRNLAADLGVNVQTVAQAVNIAIGQPENNRFLYNGRSYYVIPEVQKAFRSDPHQLANLNVRSNSGQLIPLSSIVTLKRVVVPQSLNHFQQLRAVKFQGNPAPGHTLGEALHALEQIAKQYMAPDMQYSFSGQSRQYVQSQGEMGETMLFAILFIFLILAAQFESFRDPLIVMFSVPLSMAGALLVLKLGGGTMNIYTKIGLVTLIGLISKHGILMVEFANQLQEQGRSVKEAIVEAASIRLRPILMTTAAMVLGALPLAMASGAGANSRHQIGLVIIGGMTFGTMLTLFVVPTVYTWLATKKPAIESDKELLAIEEPVGSNTGATPVD